ncbi:GNAT family N-acetyltransferase [Luteolibacter sp. Y139]|uniref:GNAT family N-acetyltransferase n=1 Tax=Luteolibacter soli TaxID=3135280 RepID=A0ABU9B4V7_9BACT
MVVRPLNPGEVDAVAELIHRSTNEWYKKSLGREIFSGRPRDCRIFPETYESLDPGCGLVVELEGKLAGVCFYHPRETHVGLGIMAVAPEFSRQGIAHMLLAKVIIEAGKLPIRLISSAMNLDSYSLYTRAGFGPVMVYQDMHLPTDAPLPPLTATSGTVRVATTADLFPMVDLEENLSGIRRAKDLAHFIQNQGGHWHTMVHRDTSGKIDGWLASVDHAGCRMIGPGVMADDMVALALLHAQLAVPRGGYPIFLVPTHESDMIAELYRWGARNLELHFTQVRGPYSQPAGLVMPSFLPESS